MPAETLSLEEQLAAVQKQLQELSQLPSSIQDTLAVVTQQLAHIVGEKITTESEINGEHEISEKEEDEVNSNADTEENRNNMTEGK